MLSTTDTPQAMAAELGERLKIARLNANFTQKELAQKAGLSIKAITNSEKGKSTLESVISILIALDMTDHLNGFIPKQTISPIQLAKLSGKQRQRASGNKKKQSNEISKQTKDDALW